jgi:hypothetical protein
MKISKARLKEIILEELDMYQIEGPVEQPEELSGEPEYEQEGYMSKSQLFKISEYAMKLHDMIEGDDDLPEWMQYKISVMSQMIGDVFHALDYDMQTGYFDQQQDELHGQESVFDSVNFDEEGYE